MSFIFSTPIASVDVPVPSSGRLAIFINESTNTWYKKNSSNVSSPLSEADLNDKVKISLTDTNEDYLLTKIIGTSGKIVLTKVNAGANEQLVISLGTDVFDKTSDNSDNITEGTTKLLLTPAERTKIANALTSIVGLDHSDLNLDDGTNPHGTTKTDVGLGNVDNTSDANKPVSTAQQTALDLKYDATNPNGFETPAQLNARDTANRNRSNHTGTQVAATISDFDTEVANNTDVAANTLKRHDPLTKVDNSNITLNLTGQQLEAVLNDTSVSAGSYTNCNVTVDAKGRITSISNGGAGSITQSHAECYFATTNTTDTVIASANSPVKVAGTTTFGFSGGLWGNGGVSNRLQWNGAATIRVKVIATATIRKTQGAGTDTYNGYIAQTAAVLVRSKASCRGEGNDLNNMACICIADIASGQYFEFYIENRDSGNDCQVVSLHLSVVQILN